MVDFENLGDLRGNGRLPDDGSSIGEDLQAPYDSHELGARALQANLEVSGASSDLIEDEPPDIITAQADGDAADDDPGKPEQPVRPEESNEPETEAGGDAGSGRNGGPPSEAASGEVDNPEDEPDGAGDIDGAEDPETQQGPVRVTHDIALTFANPDEADSLRQGVIEDLAEYRESQLQPQNFGRLVELSPDRLSRLTAIADVTKDYARSIGVIVDDTVLTPDKIAIFDRHEFSRYYIEPDTVGVGFFGSYHPDLDRARVLEGDTEGETARNVQHQVLRGACKSELAYQVTDGGQAIVLVKMQTGLDFVERPVADAGDEGIRPDLDLGAWVGDQKWFANLNTYTIETMTDEIIRENWTQHPELAPLVDDAFGGLDAEEPSEFHEIGTMIERYVSIEHLDEFQDARQEFHRACLAGDIAKVQAMLERTFGAEGLDAVKTWDEVSENWLYEELEDCYNRRIAEGN